MKDYVKSGFFHDVMVDAVEAYEPSADGLILDVIPDMPGAKDEILTFAMDFASDWLEPDETRKLRQLLESNDALYREVLGDAIEELKANLDEEDEWDYEDEEDDE